MQTCALSSNFCAVCILARMAMELSLYLISFKFNLCLNYLFSERLPHLVLCDIIVILGLVCGSVHDQDPQHRPRLRHRHLQCHLFPRTHCVSAPLQRHLRDHRRNVHALTED